MEETIRAYVLYNTEGIYNLFRYEALVTIRIWRCGY